jgi:hypothetical protein
MWDVKPISEERPLQFGRLSDMNSTHTPGIDSGIVFIVLLWIAVLIVQVILIALQHLVKVCEPRKCTN